MSKSNQWEGDVLKLYFNGVGASNLCTSSGSTTIYVRLYTSDPLEAGSSANEVQYTPYAAATVTRSTAGWAFTSVDNGPSTVNPANNIDFATPTSTGQPVVTHFGVSRAASGVVDYSGTVSPPITITAGLVPRLTTASVITED